VEWSVNPNAFKGPALLSLVAEDADGAQLPLLKGDKEWSVNVEIGGVIDVRKTGYSGALGQTDVYSFFVDFELYCQNKNLRGAQLFASIKHKKSGEQLLEVPVALGRGGYQVSWTLTKKLAPAGDYEIDVFRQVDRRRSAKAAEPFFSITHHHVPPEGQPFPVRTEFLVFLVFIAAFVWSNMKKNEILGKSQK